MASRFDIALGKKIVEQSSSRSSHSRLPCESCVKKDDPEAVCRVPGGKQCSYASKYSYEPDPVVTEVLDSLVERETGPAAFAREEAQNEARRLEEKARRCIHLAQLLFPDDAEVEEVAIDLMHLTDDALESIIQRAENARARSIIASHFPTQIGVTTQSTT